MPYVVCLMSETLERLAEELVPLVRFRRGFRVLEVDRVEVTHLFPVKLIVHRVNGSDAMPAPEELTLAWGEIIQEVSHG